MKKRLIDDATSGAPRWDHLVFFGLQMVLKRWFSQRVTVEDVERTALWCSAHGEPFPKDDWMRIAQVWDGWMPVEISALPEGSIVPLHVPLIRVVNLDPTIPWITAFIETELHRAWASITVGTGSMQCKRDIFWFLLQTCDDPDAAIGFALHDFGSRGVSSQESAGMLGAAHLVHFMGTDTTAAIHYVQAYYNELGMPGFSIPAAEHSTITSWGGPEHEAEAFANMMDKFAKPNGIFAVVSDSYDIYRAVKEIWGGALKQRVIALGDINCRLVIRPDSGDPTVVPIKVIELLGEAFGYTTNSKGFKVLPPYVRVIQGDGVNQRSIRMILKNLMMAGWSTENIAFGMGGALLQQVNRDTLQFAMKTCAITRDGIEVDVFKQPITDPGKNSKRGDQTVVQIGPIDYSVGRRGAENSLDALVKVWGAGHLFVDHTFSEVRARAAAGFKVLFERNGWKPEGVKRAA
jgi:nicotinamide phosphoribosyltransferase